MFILTLQLSERVWSILADEGATTADADVDSDSHSSHDSAPKNGEEMIDFLNVCGTFDRGSE